MKKTSGKLLSDLPQRLFEYLKRRPADFQEILHGLSVTENELRKALEILLNQEKIAKKIQGTKEIFFKNS
jgi:predicted transcriptional regulator